MNGGIVASPKGKLQCYYQETMDAEQKAVDIYINMYKHILEHIFLTFVISLHLTAFRLE